MDDTARIVEEIREHLAGREFEGRRPTTLEVGCGPGDLLDTGVVPVAGYTGVDPDADMLQRLQMKHPEARTLCGAVEDFPIQRGSKPYDIVVVHPAGVSFERMRVLVRRGGLMIMTKGEVQTEGWVSWQREAI